MMEYLKEGFHLANRNLQLVFIRLIVTLINMVGLIVFLGLPLFAAVLYLGFDMAHAENLLPYLKKNPFEFLSRYAGLVVLVSVSLIFYLICASMLILYSLSGTLGVLRTSALDAQHKFSLPSFFRGARRNFSRLFWLISLESLILTGVLAVLIFAGVAASVFLHSFAGSGTMPGMFFGSFVLLSIAVFSFIFAMIFLVFMILSVVVAVVEESGTGNTFRKTFGFLKKNPQAFFLPLLFFMGIMAVNLGLFAVRFSYHMIPVFFPFAFILSVLSAVMQNYVTVIAWGFLIVYYIKAAGHTGITGSYEI